MMQTYIKNKLIRPSNSVQLNIKNTQVIFYPHPTLNLASNQYWWKILNACINKNLALNQLCLSLLIIRVRRLHKKAGTQRRKFTLTATTYKNLQHRALQLFFKRQIHFINKNIMWQRVNIFYNITNFDNWNYQPAWVEKQLLSLARTKKLLKR